MTDPIDPATIARLRELMDVHQIARAYWIETGCTDGERLHLMRVRGALSDYAINSIPAILDQLDAQAAEIERMKCEREALVNAAMRGQRLLHVDMLGRWGDLRDAVLHGLDGLDNDQTNQVLGCIDDHFPSDINPAAAEDSSATENRADKAEARVEELEALLRRHAALSCSECHGTGCYLGEEDRNGPCNACGGTGSELPADVLAVLGKMEGGR